MIVENEMFNYKRNDVFGELYYAKKILRKTEDFEKFFYYETDDSMVYYDVWGCLESEPEFKIITEGDERGDYSYAEAIEMDIPVIMIFRAEKPIELAKKLNAKYEDKIIFRHRKLAGNEYWEFEAEFGLYPTFHATSNAIIVNWRWIEASGMEDMFEDVDYIEAYEKMTETEKGLVYCG